jgi:cytochrome c-type biogenesis protein CcmH
MALRLSSLVLSLAIAILAGLPAYAVEPDEVLQDPTLETRAREISEGLRCLVCQNQSIDDSEAPLAKDLRALVRERVAAGDSDGAIKAFLVARYGEFVLLKPRLEAETLVLWGTPIAVFLLGAGAALIAVRRRRKLPAGQEKLTPEERRKLEALLRREA